MRFNITKLTHGALLLASLFLTACGGGGGGGGGGAAVSTYAIGGTVSGLTGSLVLQNNNGDDKSIFANVPFTFATQVPFGTVYSVTVKTQSGNEWCSVNNGSGIVVTAAVTNVSIVCGTRAPRFAYVANATDNTVSIYTVNATTGLLRANGYVIAGTAPQSVTVSGTFAYVANSGSNNVSAYTINGAGALTWVANIAAGTTPQSVTVDPTGQFAYVANSGSGTVSAYTIDGITGTNTGALTWVADIATGAAPKSVTVDPTGQFAYVANSGSHDVSAYTIDVLGATGVLTPVGTVQAGNGLTSAPVSVTVDPTGQFAYVANSGSHDVSAYSIDGAGALSSVVGTVPAGTTPQSVTIDPSGAFAYVTNSVSKDVSVYTINSSTGVLTAAGSMRARPGSRSIAMSKGTTQVTYTPKFAYVADSGFDQVFAFAINALTGALTEVAGSPFAAGTGPQSVTVDPTGAFAYVANFGSGTVSAYTIDGTGALTQINCTAACTGNDFTAGASPVSVTVASTPTGQFAYVANSGSHDVSAYTIEVDGALTPVLGSPFAAGDGSTSVPMSVTVDPSGQFAYVANYDSNNVSAYTIDGTGALTPIDADVTTLLVIDSFAAGANPVSVTVDPSGQFVYVANATDYTISAYTIDPTGALTELTSSPFAAGDGIISVPMSVTVDPSGQFAYVANASDDNVSAYTINPTTGELTQFGSPIASGVTPYSVAVDPSGKFAYVANVGGQSISAYTINATTGALTSLGAPFAAGNSPWSITTTGSIQ